MIDYIIKINVYWWEVKIMEEITPENIQKIADAVAKKMANALLSGSAEAQALVAACFRCGFKGQFGCDANPFECTTIFRCGSGFVRVVEAPIL